jgi:hypothetical protein
VCIDFTRQHLPGFERQPEQKYIACGILDVGSILKILKIYLTSQQCHLYLMVLRESALALGAIDLSQSAQLIKYLADLAPRYIAYQLFHA